MDAEMKTFWLVTSWEIEHRPPRVDSGAVAGLGVGDTGGDG